MADEDPIVIEMLRGIRADVAMTRSELRHGLDTLEDRLGRIDSRVAELERDRDIRSGVDKAHRSWVNLKWTALAAAVAAAIGAVIDKWSK